MTKKKAVKGDVIPGDLARCKVTQIEGVVIVRHDYLYGMPRIGIQPEGSFEGKPHEVIHMDVAQAELLKKSIVERGYLLPNKRIELGDQGIDEISGFKGVCTGRAEWLYACTKVALQPKGLTKLERPHEHEWFDEPSVTLKKEQVIKAEVKDSKTTGGPGNKNSGFKYSNQGKL